MLFGHQNDTNHSQPQAAEQPDPGYMGPQDQVAQTVTPQPLDPVTPQEPVAQDVPVPQAPTPGVNPLAVDPATGVSLPAMAMPADSTGPVDTPSPEVDEQPSVLNQPSAPSVSAPESPDVNAAPAPAEAPAYTEDAATAYSGSPFSAAAAPASAPDPTPVVDQAVEDINAEAIAKELDTPGEDHSTVFTQDPGTPESPAADVPAATDTAAEPQLAPSYDQPANDSVSDTSAAAQSQPQPLAMDPLLDLKQQAIAQLSPLVSHLDQGPEEKFRTTMMLLQSTDNPALLHDAYTAAQSISDEGARAQALLDVVNEINYFTQQQDAKNS